MNHKRVRTVNYSEKEVTELLKLCNSYSSVLENKKTDAVTNNEKTQTWDEVEKSYNKNGFGVYRKKESLQLKYDAIKKNLRKQIAEEKKYSSGTGGGPFRPSKQLTPEEEQLYQNIKLSVEGLPNWYGSGKCALNTDYNYCDDRIEEKIDEPSVSVVAIDWSGYSANMLQTRKHQALQQRRGTVKALSNEITYETNSGITTENVPITENIESTESNNAHGVENVETVVVENVIKKRKIGHKVIKSKPFEALAIQKKILIDKELEIVEMKKDYLQELHTLEIANIKEEHDWKREKWNLEMQLLRKQLESEFV